MKKYYSILLFLLVSFYGSAFAQTNTSAFSSDDGNYVSQSDIQKWLNLKAKSDIDFREKRAGRVTSIETIGPKDLLIAGRDYHFYIDVFRPYLHPDRDEDRWKNHLYYQRMGDFETNEKQDFPISVSKNQNIIIGNYEKKGELKILKGPNYEISDSNFKRIKAQILSIKYSQDGTKFVTVDSKGRAKIKDAQSGETIHTIKQNGSLSYAEFSPTGKYVVTAGEDKTARLWDTDTGLFIRDFVGHNERLRQAKISPDEKFLVTISNDNSTKVWNLNSGSLIKTFLDHSDDVTSVDFSPKHKVFATGSSDKAINFYSYPDFTHMVHIHSYHSGVSSNIQAIKFDQNEKTLFLGGKDVFYYLDVQNIIWYSKHAKQLPKINELCELRSNAEYCNILGKLFFDGEFVEGDLDISLNYYSMGCETNNKNSCYWRDRIRKIKKLKAEDAVRRAASDKRRKERVAQFKQDLARKADARRRQNAQLFLGTLADGVSDSVRTTRQTKEETNRLVNQTKSYQVSQAQRDQWARDAVEAKRKTDAWMWELEEDARKSAEAKQKKKRALEKLERTNKRKNAQSTGSKSEELKFSLSGTSVNNSQGHLSAIKIYSDGSCKKPQSIELKSGERIDPEISVIKLYDIAPFGHIETIRNQKRMEMRSVNEKSCLETYTVPSDALIYQNHDQSYFGRAGTTHGSFYLSKNDVIDAMQNTFPNQPSITPNGSKQYFLYDKRRACSLVTVRREEGYSGIDTAGLSKYQLENLEFKIAKSAARFKEECPNY